MKVFVAGATGALGKQLVPRLVAARARGHRHDPQRVQAGRSCARSARGPSWPTRSTPTRSRAPSREAEPEVIVHQLTALSGSLDLRHFDRDFALTNRLRTEGTDHLLAAGRAVGVRRFVAQSYAGWPFARTGGPVKTEDDPLDPSPPRRMRRDARRRSATLEARRDRRGLDRGRRAPLRRLLRPGHVARHRTAGARSRRSASASSRSSATARACGRSSTSRTPRTPRSRPSSAARAGSTTSSTTSPRRWPSGCRLSRARSAPSRPRQRAALARAAGSPARPRRS